MKRITAWWKARQVDKAFDQLFSPDLLDTTYLRPAIHRESHERYPLGEMTVTVMREMGRAGKIELEVRLTNLNSPDVMREAAKKLKAREVWMGT